MARDLDPNVHLPRDKFYGCYTGLVEWNQDPLQLNRIKARVPIVHGTKEDTLIVDLPWCYVVSSQGGGVYDKGNYNAPDIGAAVIIIFEDGEPDYPVCLGTYYSMPIKMYHETGTDLEGEEDTSGGRSEPPIEAMGMIDDEPSTQVIHKDYVSGIHSEAKKKFTKMIAEHFTSEFQLKMEDKEIDGAHLKDMTIGNKNRSLRFTDGNYFKGTMLKDFDVSLELSEDGQEIRLTVFGKKVGSLLVDKKTNTLILSFDKVIIMGNTEIMGNLKNYGKTIGD